MSADLSKKRKDKKKKKAMLEALQQEEYQDERAHVLLADEDDEGITEEFVVHPAYDDDSIDSDENGLEESDGSGICAKIFFLVLLLTLGLAAGVVFFELDGFKALTGFGNVEPTVDSPVVQPENPVTPGVEDNFMDEAIDPSPLETDSALKQDNQYEEIVEAVNLEDVNQNTESKERITEHVEKEGKHLAESDKQAAVDEATEAVQDVTGTAPIENFETKLENEPDEVPSESFTMRAEREAVQAAVDEVWVMTVRCIEELRALQVVAKASLTQTIIENISQRLEPLRSQLDDLVKSTSESVFDGALEKAAELERNLRAVLDELDQARTQDLTLAEEDARLEEEKAAREAEERAAKEAEERAAKEAEERAAKEAEERAAKEAEDRAAKEAEEKRIREAEEKAAKEAEERAAREAEEKHIREAEEKRIREAEEQAAKEAEERAAREAEEKRIREAEEKRIREAEERAAKEAMERAAKEAEDRAAKEAEEKRIREAEEKAAKEAEERAAREAEERAAKEAEERAAKEAEEKRIRLAEEQAAKEAEERAAKEAEEKRIRLAEEQAAKEAEIRAAREAEEKRIREAEEQRAREAEEQRIREAEEKRAREAEEQRAREAEEKRAREAEEQRVREAEERAAQEEQERVARQLQETAQAAQAADNELKVETEQVAAQSTEQTVNDAPQADTGSDANKESEQAQPEVSEVKEPVQVATEAFVVGQSEGQASSATEQNTDVPTRMQNLEEADRLVDQSPAQALSLMEQILEKDPTNALALYGRARSLDSLAEVERSNARLEQSIFAYRAVLDLEDRVDDELFLKSALRCIDRMRFRGFHGKSIRIQQRLVARFPDQIEYQNQLAVGFLLTNQPEAARTVLERVLERWPNSGFAQVHLGFILKTTFDDYDAGARWMMAGIASREEGVIDGRFYSHLGDALARLGRHQEAQRIYAEGEKEGVFRSRDQRSLYNVDRLTSQPWWDKESTTYGPFFDIVEANWKQIRDEGVALLTLESPEGFADESEKLRDSGDWKQYELFAQGRKNVAHCNKAPITCTLVENYPPALCKRGQVKFSIMHPGTHVWPHTGPTNCRVRAHLGLVVPGGAEIRVGNTTKTWEEGKFIIFDDSFEHEVWHNGPSYRLVLIVDLWHPELTQDEWRTLAPI